MRNEKFKYQLLPFIVALLSIIHSYGSNKNEPILKKVYEHPIPFQPKHYICQRTSEGLDIDGDINDSDWEKALWTDYFVDIEGDLKPEPRYKTRVKMLWDDEYLYFAVEMEEPHLWATLKQHDTIIYYDNDFEIFIDPNGTTHNYYEYEVNAINTHWDLLVLRPYRDYPYYPAVDSWEILGMKSAIKLYGSLNNPNDQDDKWTLEVAFPWSVLIECNTWQQMPEGGDQWRLNFSRVQWHLDIVNGGYIKKKGNDGNILPEDNWVWSPQGFINMHRPETWGYLQFSGKMVGKPIDEFKEDSDEKIKWALRQVYYRQHAYRAENKRFASKAESLRLQEIQLNGKAFNPSITTSYNRFSASYPSSSQDGVWTIHSDSKIEFEKYPKHETD